MIDHVSIKVTDYARARAFYEAALRPLGYVVVMEFPDAAGLGAGGKPDFWISRGERTAPVHLAFAGDRAQVDAFHAAALAAGGSDFGQPGLRAEYHPHYYGAFILDPDGNNVEVVCHSPTGRVEAANGAAAGAKAKRAVKKAAKAVKKAAKGVAAKAKDAAKKAKSAAKGAAKKAAKKAKGKRK